MSRPGVEVTSAAAAPPVGVSTDTSVAFIVGEAEMGPTDKATRITSLDQFTATYGDRIPGVVSYDAVDTYFHEGGSTAYFMRLADSSAAVATASASSVAGTGQTANAANPGAWGNDLELDVVTAPGVQTEQQSYGFGDEADGEETTSGGSSSGNGDTEPLTELLTFGAETQATGPQFIATVKLAGKAVQTSIAISTRDDLASFLSQAGWMTLAGPASSSALTAGTVTLSGGSDGAVPVTDSADLVTALDAINRELGPGQVLAPGRSDATSQAALLAHAAATNRFALLDCGPSDTAQTLTSMALALRGADQDRYGSLWAPWAVIPGVAPGTSRTVPWSPIQAALCARNDASGNPNQAAAGSWGISQYALSLTMTYTNTEMEDLLYAGVDTARVVYGAIEAYAFRTLVDPAGPRYQWLQANWARLAMALTAESEAVGEDFVFSQIDGRGLNIAAFNGALAAVCKEFYDDGALYGDDVTEAFVVNTGPAVNTPDTIADGRLRAVLSVRMSPHAELVQIPIVKYPVTQALV
jgi:hypothetical protein